MNTTDFSKKPNGFLKYFLRASVRERELNFAYTYTEIENSFRTIDESKWDRESVKSLLFSYTSSFYTEEQLLITEILKHFETII